MVDFILNLLITIGEFIVGFLPALPQDSPYYAAMTQWIEPFNSAYSIASRVPVLKVFVGFASFLVLMITMIYIYKAFAWAYNMFRGRMH